MAHERNVISLLTGKKIAKSIWDIFLFIERTFPPGELIDIPSDKVLQMHSPRIDGELRPDGEAYIL